MGNDKYLINASPLENGGYWMTLLEKAYAKMNVNYSNINSGSPTQSFRDMTGMPVARYDVTK